MRKGVAAQEAPEMTGERPLQKAEQIYGLLRQAIVRLAMVPGAAISEKELCLQYGVSRTPVREALKRLAEEDLVDVFPHSGTYVSKISYEVAEEGFVIRRALEIESIRRATRFVTEAEIRRLDALIAEMRDILRRDALTDYIEVDDAFHATIAEISRFPRIWKFINLMKAHLDRMRQLSAPVPGHLAEVTEQHAAIVRALERRNADQAELAMKIHLDASFAVMSAMHEDGQFFRRND
ncbi:GntR family transcriptional regulator [Aureimonas endophytica]|uniref:GntR family transcriptional regulator n=1 Tax=Aureimonas endophytica TaxID=2027858 RepID=A0A916ZI16_9HYPH|nr:GntR family transcriptional regulator [Aureimonas endophytica]GGD98942.1 GntR family transcriptional regulator [Aureimonas endophytica]